MGVDHQGRQRLLPDLPFGSAPDELPVIVDAHMHVWNPHTASNPWRPGWAKYAPRAAFSPQGALQAMARAGVDRALLIPPEWDRSASHLAGAAARQYPDRFRAFGSVSLSTPLSPDTLRRFCLDLGLSGLRQVLLPRSSHRALGDTAWLWAALDACALPVMVWMPGQLSLLREIVARHPRLRIAVDHLNLPMIASRQEARAAVAELCALADHQNVSVKISALPSLTRSGFALAELTDIAQRAVHAYGPSRVFWGADFLRLPCPYREALQMVLDATCFTPTERELILGQAALQWVGWSVPERASQPQREAPAPGNTALDHPPTSPD